MLSLGSWITPALNAYNPFFMTLQGNNIYHNSISYLRGYEDIFDPFEEVLLISNPRFEDPSLNSYFWLRHEKNLTGELNINFLSYAHLGLPYDIDELPLSIKAEKLFYNKPHIAVGLIIVGGALDKITAENVFFMSPAYMQGATLSKAPVTTNNAAFINLSFVATKPCTRTRLLGALISATQKADINPQGALITLPKSYRASQIFAAIF